MEFRKELKDIHDDAISTMVSVRDQELWSGSWDAYVSVVVRGNNMDLLQVDPSPAASVHLVPKKKKVKLVGQRSVFGLRKKSGTMM